MKRLFSLFAALVVAAALVLSPAVHAEQGGIFTLSDASNISPGQTFDVTLSISGDYAVHGMNLSIEYDPTALVLESCTNGDFLANLSSQGQFYVLDATTLANAGMVKLAVICPVNPVSGSGELFTMHFRLKDGVTVNQQVIMVVHEFILLPVGSTEKTNVPFTTDNSIITVTGGSTPDGGYNEGGSGIGNNNSDSPEYPTREPDDPDANVTPAVDITPEPDYHATAAPQSAAPFDTVEPAQTGEPEPGETDAADTEAPDGTAEVSETDDAKPTAEPEKAENVTKEPDDPGRNGKKNLVLPIVIGAVVLLGAAAAVLFARGRKK
ncbi:MAG: hypothetical protein IIT70_02565 [Clostridia bacterium]|nr:hypothetical protein [Clostridia bacterium]